VATAQAVATTASAGSMFASFTLRLNSAILALSMNATSVAFADVVVETSATQPVTLTSGVACPRTINLRNFDEQRFHNVGGSILDNLESEPGDDFKYRGLSHRNASGGRSTNDLEQRLGKRHGFYRPE
jgi:hypothetical protein